MNLSFAGCGFLGIYHVGVAVCFKKYAPHLLLDKISGASAGCLAATCLLCDMPLGEMTSDFFRVVNEARSHSLGPFSPSFNIQTCLLEGLQKFLPPDAHTRVNGRLHVSLTRSYDGKNIIVSHFDSREDLLQALLCACFIPGFSGILPPRFQGIRYMDGAFSDNLPVLDENTVTVSPFCGESDICPRDQSAQLFHVNWANTSIELSRQNINRFVRILFPPKPEVLSNMCQQGFDDALQFLHRNNLISCTRCLAVQSTFVVQEAIPEAQEEFDPECTECQQHRKDALIGDMPETVLTVFQTYIESANKGLANWMFRHKGAKLLQALSLPATVPADFVCATLTNMIGDTYERRQFSAKIVGSVVRTSKKPNFHFEQHSHAIRVLSAAPCLREQFWSLSKYVLGQLNVIIKSRNHHKLSTNLTCQLAHVELNGKQKNKHILTHRSSKIDIFVSAECPATQIAPKDSIPTKEMAAKRETETIDEPDAIGLNITSGEVDTFDHILEVTSHHEAVYAYYYMDENNKVKITEIFDMTDSDSPVMQTFGEREANQQLQFDTEWDVVPPTDCMYGGISDCHRNHTCGANPIGSNNNSINLSNHQNHFKRQISITKDDTERIHSMNEDDLENLINQTFHERWQNTLQAVSQPHLHHHHHHELSSVEQQLTDGEESSSSSRTSGISSSDENEALDSTVLISENAAKALARSYSHTIY